MCFREVLPVGALTFVEVRDSVEAQPVEAEGEPESDDVLDLVPDVRVVEVEVGLVVEEAVPVVGIGDWIPRPVRLVGIGEYDPRVSIPAGCV